MDLDNINFDDLYRNKDQDKEETAKERTLSQIFEEERKKWSAKIAACSKKMKDIYTVSELTTEIYTERQLAVEYHHYLMTVFAKITRNYRKQWNERYEYYSYKSQKRFPNEKTKELQILGDIENILEKREELEIQIKFMGATIGSLDNIIYGIKYKVELENIIRGNR